MSSASQSRVRGDHPRSHEWRSVIFRHEASTTKKKADFPTQCRVHVYFSFIYFVCISVSRKVVHVHCVAMRIEAKRVLGRRQNGKLSVESIFSARAVKLDSELIFINICLTLTSKAKIDKKLPSPSISIIECSAMAS